MREIVMPVLDNKNCKYLNFISMLFITIMLGTYMLAYKMIDMFGIIQSGGIFIFPITYSLSDITTEVYGFEETKKMVKSAFICCLLFSLVVPLIAFLPPPKDWPYQHSYTYIFGHVLRFFTANTLGIAIGIILNGKLISKWKVLLQGRYFWLRSIGASAIGELITSIIADIIAFFGTTNFLGLIKLMIAIYAVKFLYACLLAVPSTLIVTFLKIKEGIVSFDQNLNETEIRDFKKWVIN